MDKKEIIDNINRQMTDIEQLMSAMQSKFDLLKQQVAVLEQWKDEPVIVEVVKEKIVEKIERVEVPVEVRVVERVEVKPEPVIERVEPKVEVKTEPVIERVEPKVEEKPVAPPQPKPAEHTVKASDIKTFGTPVDAIRKAIPLIDRLLYQKELFGDDAEKFNAELTTLDTMDSYETAHNYLKTAYPHWDESDATVEGFLRAVHRRFL